MLYEKILEYREELFDDLNRLLSIESVDGARDGDCAAALDFILKRAEDFGLTAERVTAKSAHVDLGKGGRLCGVLSHLDVVPAGNNWTVNPYALTERDGRLYGRGVADDKGAALVNLYCLRALKEMGIEGRNTLRAIYGTAEETGMSDMDGYFAQKRLPDLAFTPDSEYGVCYAEKGILQLEVSTPTNEAKVLSQFHAGKAINAVPDLAYVMLDSSGYDEQLLMRLADASEGNFEFNYTIDGLMIISRGKAAHACEPQKGFNAAAALIDLITHAYDVYEIGALSSFIDYAINCETNGRSLGLKMSDAVSGALTVNLGNVHIEGTEARAQFDIRYPVTVNGDYVLRQFRSVAENNHLTVRVLHHDRPLYVEKDSELVRLLADAYRTVTGEDAPLYTTGGGTYARKLGGKGVAFGPNFRDDDIRMHNADESVDKENFLRHMQICFEALYRLYTLE
ncbi:MAG: Sapep family Mn(2+)-dependent dipeptidase [Ruminococcus sp.]|nr:Sapep family Mn(2+)-dependent dipeptidase [uncultured Ruminococcus sp.]MBQ1616620.1 Sapep family Mn(2+)-dependent dipeptidase [Ruminococcus sp.]MBQ2470764.1 Sapep family Mn(2+)-dependent dipeptidase [Ruminococcus sp.]MBQ4260538.1 Sapep family Mn(2+)-dependent dipeptidase [Ruminococcus sp.]